MFCAGAHSSVSLVCVLALRRCSHKHFLGLCPGSAPVLTRLLHDTALINLAAFCDTAEIILAVIRDTAVIFLLAAIRDTA